MLGFLKKLFGLSNEEEASAISSRMSAWQRTKKERSGDDGPQHSAQSEQKLAELQERLNSGGSGCEDSEATIERARRLREMAERTSIDSSAIKNRAAAEQQQQRPQTRLDKPVHPDYIEPGDEPTNPWSKGS